MRRFISTFLILIVTSSQFYGQTRKDSLYVFVGQKIAVTQFHPKVDSNELLMDGAFKAKYKVVQNIFGNFLDDTIEFDAYDHYGIPAFSKYKYVLLFVSNVNGHLYHEKYQFFDVYQTKDGRWASPFDVRLYKGDRSAIIKPQKVDFLKRVSYRIKRRNKSDIQEIFPAPYYTVVGNKAIAVYGNYVEELFEFEKETVLKDRGIF